MKKSYVKILALVPLFALSACHSDEGNITGVSTPKAYPTNNIDTMRVIGVFNATQGYYTTWDHYKYVKCVDKNNRTIEFCFDVHNEPKNDVTYTERGDTILMNGNMFVKNLTQERLQSEFVKGR